jgi:hypothetical protein
VPDSRREVFQPPLSAAFTRPVSTDLDLVAGFIGYSLTSAGFMEYISRSAGLAGYNLATPRHEHV